MNRQFTKEDMQMKNESIKRYPMSLAIKETQVQTIVKYAICLLKWLKFKIVLTPNAGEDAGKLYCSCITCWDAKLYSHSGKLFISFL